MTKIKNILMILFLLISFNVLGNNVSLKNSESSTGADETWTGNGSGAGFIQLVNDENNPVYYQLVGGGSSSGGVDTIYIRHTDTIVVVVNNNTYETITLEVLPDTVLTTLSDIYSDSIVSLDFSKVIGDTITADSVYQLLSEVSIDTISFTKVIGDTIEGAEVDELRENLSAGVVDTPTLTNNLDGSVTISNDGTYRLFSNVDFAGNINKYSINGDSFTLVNDTTNYIVVDYNGGSPIIRNTTDVLEINESTILPIFTIVRADTYLARLNWNSMGKGLVNKLHRRFVKTERFRIQSGLELSETGTRNIIVDTGIVWYGSKEEHLTQVNSSFPTDFVWLFRKVGGVWDVEISNQYNNMWYQNGNDTAEVNENEYVVNYVFRNADENEENLGIVLGTKSYDLFNAEKAELPDELPQTLKNLGVFVGKIIVRKGQNKATIIQQYDKATDLIESVDSNRTQIEELLAGTIEDKQYVCFSYTDTQILACLEKDGGGTELVVNLNAKEYIIETDTVALILGDSVTPVYNYIYIKLDGDSNPKLYASSTKPTGSYATVGHVTVFDTVYTQSKFLNFQRYTDSRINNQRGMFAWQREKERLRGAVYDVGVDPTLNISINLTDVDTVHLNVTSGVVKQLHPQNYLADTTRYIVVNHPTEAWKVINHLGEIDVDASGNSLRGNNTYYSLQIFGNQSSQSFLGYKFVMLPLDSFGSAEEAQFNLRYDVTSVPFELRQQAFRICRVVLRYQTILNGTITNVLGGTEVQNRRGSPFGITGGGGAGSTTTNTFQDSLFNIYDDVDSTKKGQFEMSGITTGTTRTLTFPDKNGTIALLSDIGSDTISFTNVVGDTITKTEADNNYLNTTGTDTATGNIYFGGNVYMDVLSANTSDTLTFFGDLSFASTTNIFADKLETTDGYFWGNVEVDNDLTVMGDVVTDTLESRTTGQIRFLADANIDTAFIDYISGGAAIWKTSINHNGQDFLNLTGTASSSLSYFEDSGIITKTISNGAGSDSYYRSIHTGIMPDDFDTMCSFDITSRRNGDVDTMYIILWQNGVAVDTFYIVPTNDLQFQTFQFIPSTVWNYGDRFTLEFFARVGNAEVAYLSGVHMCYRRKYRF